MARTGDTDFRSPTQGTARSMATATSVVDAPLAAEPRARTIGGIWTGFVLKAGFLASTGPRLPTRQDAGAACVNRNTTGGAASTNDAERSSCDPKTASSDAPCQGRGARHLLSRRGDRAPRHELRSTPRLVTPRRSHGRGTHFLVTSRPNTLCWKQGAVRASDRSARNNRRRILQPSP